MRWGKVRYVGCSNYQVWELAQALAVSERLGIGRYDCDQPRYNILYREIENELLPLCRAEGVGIIAYNPLAGGFLTGKYEGSEGLRENTRFTLGSAGPRYRARYWEDAQFREIERLADVLRRAWHLLPTPPSPGSSPKRARPRPSSERAATIRSRTRSGARSSD